MKKTYQQPLIMVAKTELTLFICGSQDVTSSNGITYGGIDEQGEKDPESRRRHDVWEEEEEEDF